MTIVVRSDPDEASDVLVLGASYLGAELVYLLRRRAPQLRITVVDRQRAHGYIPLVHERLVGRIDWEDTRFQTADFVAREGASFVEGEIVSADLATHNRVVLADGRTLSARFVVVALGSITTPPEHLPGRERFAGHKLAAETDEARVAVERSLSPVSPSDETPRAVVVGGGISGIEMAGELAHLAANRPRTLRAPRVTLVHGAARLVPHLSATASEAVERALVAQGVTLCHQTRVLGAEEGGLRVRDAAGVESVLPTDLSFWCGGVRAPAVLAKLGLPLRPDGFLRAGPDLSCLGAERGIFAGGDCVRIVDPEGGDVPWPTMQRAIECLWAADTISHQITTLAREPVGYPRGTPKLRRHPLRADFFHGLSLGQTSLVVLGDRVLDLPHVNVWFRRFLMGGYFRRYGQWSSRWSRALTRALPTLLIASLFALLWTGTASATPPPTEEESKRMREAEAVRECLHCAGRGEPAQKDYLTCPYLAPYGFAAEKRYLDGSRYGTFFCRARKPDNTPLPDDLRSKAERGEDDVPATKVAPAKGSCSLGHTSAPNEPGVPAAISLVAVVALGARRCGRMRANVIA